MTSPLLLSYIKQFDQIYYPKLAKRANTFREVLTRLPDRPTIVETGMINDPGNWPGHGQSTVLWESVVQNLGGYVFSVDINPEAIAITRKLVGYDVNLVSGNSLNFLAAFKQPIDLLYLDSYDFVEGKEARSARHHLFELMNAMKNLHPGSIVYVDDTVWYKDEPPYGKGALICEYMKEMKAERITDGNGIQEAWVVK